MSDSSWLTWWYLVVRVTELPDPSACQVKPFKSLKTAFLRRVVTGELAVVSAPVSLAASLFNVLNRYMGCVSL